MEKQVSILTPPGRSAIATLVCHADDVHDLLSEFFSPVSGRLLSNHETGKIVFGSWTQPGGQHSEDVVLCRKDEKTIEINCHGGTAAVSAIESNLNAIGFQTITWQQWAELNEKDSVCGEAERLLSSCPTFQTSLHMLDQSNGALSREFRLILDHLEMSERMQAIERLQELQAFASVGTHLIEPFEVVLAGIPNAGKSSLLNCLLGFDRAIVADIAGTTRDVLTGVTAIQGWPVKFLDTAGIRESGSAIEQLGVHKSIDQLADADLVIWVDAIDDEWVAPPFTLPNTTIFVFNKSDLLTDTEAANALSMRPDGIPVSALNGQGITTLFDRLLNSLLPATPVHGQPLLFTKQQAESVSNWLTLLANDCDNVVKEQIQSTLKLVT